MDEKTDAIEIAKFIIQEYDEEVNKETAVIRFVSSREFDLLVMGVEKHWISERFQIQNNGLMLDGMLTLEVK